MKAASTKTVSATDRKGERGAALITALLLSMLLLTAGGALIMSTAMTAATSGDATGEAQAYVAAEAGLQATLNVLRGNVAPNPLLVSNPTGGGIADGNKISFRRAVERASSNKDTDPTSAPIRLSRWLNYDYTPAGGAYASRVGLSDPYSPVGGMAYSVTVEDADNSTAITYDTSGKFTGGVGSSVSADGKTLTIPGVLPANSATITYTPQPATAVTANLTTTSSLGSFTVNVQGLGAVVPVATLFRLTVNQSAPYTGTKTYIGTVTGAATPGGLLIITFIDVSALVGDTRFVLNLPALTPKVLVLTSPGTTTLQATITAPEPHHLLVRSTGYGPRGSRKLLAMLIDRFKFDLDPPSPLVIRGADKPDSTTAAPTMTFDLGSSNAKKYTGKDAAGIDTQKPTIAISLHDWTKADGGIKKGSTVDDPELSVLDLDAIPNPWPSTLTPVPSSTPPSAKTPWFLETADKAREFLDDLEITARNQGRYFTAIPGNMAGDDNPYTPMLTFVDGNCDLDGGAGLLVCTGTLDMRGNADFQGIILVLGNGTVTRNGGGDGNINGSWIIASFIRNPTALQSRKFLAPSFNVSGGGNGTFTWNTDKIKDANEVLGGRVAGVVEY